MYHLPTILVISFATAPTLSDWQSAISGFINTTLETSTSLSPAIQWFGQELTGLTVDDAREVVSLQGYGGTAQPTFWVLLADATTEAAQNVLLKTLEEPPTNVRIILAVSSNTTLLPTIHSRCDLRYFSASQPLIVEESNQSAQLPTGNAFIATIANRATSVGQLITVAASYKERPAALTLVSSCLYALTNSEQPTPTQSQLLKCTLQCWQDLSQNANVALALEHWLFTFHDLLTDKTPTK